MVNKLLRSVLMLSVVFAFCAGSALAQSGTIEGQLTDQETGEPIIGANVFIQSINRGAATDAEGNFTIQNVPYGTYKLSISYIGYAKKTIPVKVDQETVTVDETLAQDVAQLEDVVVTAYGVEKQINELPYSAQNLNTEEVTSNGSDNFLNSLSGRVSGMKVQSSSGVGASTDIVLRGNNSLTGNNQALFVVDGVPYANSRFNSDDIEEGYKGFDYGNTGVDIDPNNIKSITVLKGPSAAALYGSRASNGAILIQTKKGTTGQKSTDISFKSSVGVSRVNSNTFPDYQKEYGAGYTDSFLSQDIDGDGTEDVTSRYTADASFGPKFDPDLMVFQWDALYPDSPTYQQASPWVAAENTPLDFFETGVNLKNSLSVNGGISDGGFYNIGYSQGNQWGILPNTELQNYNLNFSAGYDISDKITVSGKIDYTKRNSNLPGRGYNSLMSNFRQWWETNVDIDQQKTAYFRNKQNVTWNPNAGSTSPFYWNNPYFTRYQNYATQERDRYVGYAKFTYDVLDWLSLTGRASIDNYTELDEERYNIGSTGNPNTGLPSYTRRNYDHTEYNFDILANYDKQLNEKIAIDGVVGANIRRTYDKNIDASTNGGLLVPGLYSLDNSVEQIGFPAEDNIKLGVNGYFASFNLNYDDYLNLALTGRRDKSSSLPEDNNVYYYPSASLGFTFNRFIDADWFTLGKIRGSVSSVGATAPAFSLVNTFNRPTNFGSSGLYSVPSTQNNSELKPERTKSWEVGLQLGFFNNRIFADATYYKNNTTDQILPVNVSAASGYTSSFINAGNVENRGLELQLRGRPVQTSDFSWEISANWNKNINKVKELTEDVDYFEFAAPQGGVSIGGVEGGTYGVIRGSDFVYNDQGQRLVDEDGFYQISNSTNEDIGNMNPDWRGGLSNNFSYKNISLNVLVDVRWGGDIFSVDQWYGEGTGLYKNTAGLNQKGNPKRDPVSEGGGVLLSGVKEDGSANDIYVPANGSFGYGVNPNARYVYDASYVKLREVGFTYNLPTNFIGKLGVLDSASLSVIGRNLWIIHKNLPNADPEQNLAGGNIQGYQGGDLPATRNVTFNLKLNF